MLGALVGAGASLLGGLLNKSSSDKAQAASQQQALRQEALQKEFAQHGIQWRVEDAKKAGIHPIYALGGSGASYSPVSSNFSADTSIGSALAAAGQDVSGAINRTRTQGQREDAFTIASKQLALEKGGLENELLRTEIASKTGRLRQSSGPPFPGSNFLIPGQAQSGLVKDKPLERVNADPGATFQEPGAITDRGYARTAGGGLMPVPSADVKERIEDNWFQEMAHFMRNNVMPMFTQGDTPPYPAPAGSRWYFHPIDGFKLTKDADFARSQSKFNGWMNYYYKRPIYRPPNRKGG